MSFGSDVLAFVDAVAELAGRLERRGWTEVSVDELLGWDWSVTALPAEVWDGGGPGGIALLPCTSIGVSPDGEAADQLAVEVTLVGEPDAQGSGRFVRPAQLTDDVLAELEAYQVGQPDLPLPTVETAG